MCRGTGSITSQNPPLLSGVGVRCPPVGRRTRSSIRPPVSVFPTTTAFLLFPVRGLRVDSITSRNQRQLLLSGVGVRCPRAGLPTTVFRPPVRGLCITAVVLGVRGQGVGRGISRWVLFPRVGVRCPPVGRRTRSSIRPPVSVFPTTTAFLLFPVRGLRVDSITSRNQRQLLLSGVGVRCPRAGLPTTVFRPPVRGLCITAVVLGVRGQGFGRGISRWVLFPRVGVRCPPVGRRTRSSIRPPVRGLCITAVVLGVRGQGVGRGISRWVLFPRVGLRCPPVVWVVGTFPPRSPRRLGCRSPGRGRRRLALGTPLRYKRVGCRSGGVGDRRILRAGCRGQVRVVRDPSFRCVPRRLPVRLVPRHRSRAPPWGRPPVVCCRS
jgi:hypothetical protein